MSHHLSLSLSISHTHFLEGDVLDESEIEQQKQSALDLLEEQKVLTLTLTLTPILTLTLT